MEKPNVTHAGCGGSLFRSAGVLLCERCHAPIIDARELTPRPKVELHQPDSGVLLRTYLERRSRHLSPATCEVF